MYTQIIKETIDVDSAGNAKCIQEIKFNNADQKPYSFSGLFETSFHKNCEDFKFTESSGAITALEVAVNDEPYNKVLIYSLAGTLQPDQSASFTLSYEWKNFRDEAGFRRISTRFDLLTSYNLTIIVNDDSFTDHLISDS